MPYVTDDDSKAVARIAEVTRELQETKANLAQRLADVYAPTTVAELIERERSTKALTDRIQALATALELQRALASPTLHEQERRLAKSSPKKMKGEGRLLGRILYPRKTYCRGG